MTALVLAVGSAAPAFATDPEPSEPVQTAPPTEPEESDLVDADPEQVDDLPSVPVKPPVDQPDGQACEPGYRYQATSKSKEYHKGVGVTQSNYNGTSRTARSTFTSEVAGKVGVSYSGKLGVKVSVAIVDIESALVTTGCTDSSEPGDASSRRPVPSSSAPASSGQPDEGQVSVVEPPELDGSERMAGEQPETKGNASFSYAKGAAGDALIVAVRCRGAGTIKVVVKTVNVSFPLECLAGKTRTTYNQIGVSGAEKPGTVSVTTPSEVHWSMTIGRGEPPAEDQQ
ncbi:hypothetical protein AB0H30_30930 [Streptomyces pseudogriseolus]|uniref:hypothetical protein n=1 Tax=Streptomyces pseudogriseolus TaxID=36817 RepID=UPI003476FFBD